MNAVVIHKVSITGFLKATQSANFDLQQIGTLFPTFSQIDFHMSPV